MNALLPDIWQTANAWAACIGRASLVACLVIVAAWAIARWCTFLSPRVVCWIWRLACCKLLLALIWIQPVDLALLPAPSRTASMPEVKLPAAPQPQPLPAIESKHPQAATGQLATVPATPFGVSDLVTGLLLPAWLVGAACCIARTARQWRSIRHLRSSSELCASDLVLRLCQEEGQRLSVHRLPPLRLSRQVGSPLLIGSWRPTIILPDRIEENFDQAELRLMIAHELSHLKRHDLAWNWLPTVAAWLFFFHPLVWLMIRRWFEAQEAACDELLIQRHVAAPVDYGRLLVKLAARASLESHSSLAAAGVLGAYRNLERRILAMTRVKAFSARRFAIAAGVLSIAAALTIVPWRLVAAEPKPEKEKPPLAAEPTPAEEEDPPLTQPSSSAN
ncbi:MAG TPA: M56 family metallopeptidase [Pirellulales bacterium]